MKKKVITCTEVNSVPSLVKPLVERVLANLEKNENLTMEDIVSFMQGRDALKTTKYILAFEDGTTMVSMTEIPKGTSVIYKPYEK